MRQSLQPTDADPPLAQGSPESSSLLLRGEITKTGAHFVPDPLRAEHPSRRGSEEIRVCFSPRQMQALSVDCARVAVVNFLFARKQGGQFLVRIEDSFGSSGELTRTFQEDLAWLGLDFDGAPALASSRLGLYRTKAEELVAKHAAFLDGDGAIYLPPTEVEDSASVPGKIKRGRNSLVLVDSEGRPARELASAVDDLTQRITHLIQPGRRLPGGARARYASLVEALGGIVPEFHRIVPPPPPPGGPKAPPGQVSPLTLREVRALGVTPLALLNWMLGLTPGVGPTPRLLSIGELIAAFDPRTLRVPQAPLNEDLASAYERLRQRTPAARRSIGSLRRALAQRSPELLARLGEPALRALAEMATASHEGLDAAVRIAELIVAPPVRDPNDRDVLTQPNVTREVSALRRHLVSLPGSRFGIAEIAGAFAALHRNVSASTPPYEDALRWMLVGVTRGPPLPYLMAILGKAETLARIDLGLTMAYAPDEDQQPTLDLDPLDPWGLRRTVE